MFDVPLLACHSVRLQEQGVCVLPVVVRRVTARDVGGDSQRLAPDSGVVARRVEALDWRGVEQQARGAGLGGQKQPFISQSKTLLL